MSESPDIVVKLLTMLSEHFTKISVVVVLFIFRKAITDLISRLTSFIYKKGDSHVSIEAASPIRAQEKTQLLEDAMEKPRSEDEEENLQLKAEEQNWFSDMYSAFSEGRSDEADQIFKKYVLDEKDPSKIEENKALYLYLRFEKAKDNLAIEELEKLAKTASTEESKFSALMWLDACLSNSMQTKRIIELWRLAEKEATTPLTVTRAVVNLAYALNKDNQNDEARKVLLRALKEAKEMQQLSSIYEALSKIESSLGNEKISIYCKDKSLEYDPNNRDELFNTSYAASNQNVDEISLSNYITLLNIDGENSTAWNNLGVIAQEDKLKVIAVDNYKKSSSRNNTLAMANQGYLLLDAGFVSEAEEIAEKALELDDTHQNVYSLLTAINKQKEEERKKWEELKSKALSRQRSMRAYVEQYYLGKSVLLEGDWILQDKYKIHITLDEGLLDANWEEKEQGLSLTTYEIELKGKVTGSTFSGTYWRKSVGGVQTGLLGLPGNKSIPCIGFLSEDEKTLNILASKMNEEFFLCLTRSDV